MGSSPESVLHKITEYCLSQIEYLESSKGLLNHGSYEGGALVEYDAWSLTCVILSMFSKLKTILGEVEANQTEEEKSIEILSIQSQINVQKSIELVIGFGILPYVLPGVGVPKKLRKMNPNVSQFLPDVEKLSTYDQYLRLSHTNEILLNCCSHPSLSVLIVKYTSDILAGLLQICKSPIASPKKINAQSSKKGALSEEQYENVMMIREKLEKVMASTFLVIVPKSTLINSLFLIGVAEKPRWISASCNDLLFSILVSENGLISVSTTMAESSGPSDTWKLMRVISSLMKNAVIKSGQASCHEKLRSLSEQCLYLMGEEMVEDGHGSNDHKNVKKNFSAFECKINEDLKKIGLFCGLTLMDMDFEFAKQVFWNKLFCHALMLDMRQKNLETNEKNATHEMLTSSSNHRNFFASLQKVAVCASSADCLLHLMKPMSINLPLALLQPVWSLFLQIFVACGRYLKRPVQEPNVAAAAEQLYHKLRDVLILLFEIYSSGSGQNLVVPTSGSTACKDKSCNNAMNMKSSDNIDLCDFTMMLLLNQDCHNVPVLNTFHLRDTGESGQVQIVRVHQEIISPASSYKEVYEQYLDCASLFLCSEILKDGKLKTVWPLLFRQLLTWGTKRHGSQQTSSTHKMKSFESDKMPTNLEMENEDAVSLDDCHRFIVFRLLGELGEEESILEQFAKAECVDESLELIELLLNKFTEEACINREVVFDSSQLVMYTLGIIGSLVEAASMVNIDNLRGANPHPSTSFIDNEVTDVWHNLKIFIPHLRKLSQCSQSSFLRVGIPEMASNLIVSIASNGAGGHTRKKNQGNVWQSRFQVAIEDAASPMVHVKGHGILELRRLIQEKDQETLQNERQVLRIFQNNLGSEDSYVYLMSIQGLETIALKFHKTVVPVLIKEYDFTSCSYDEVSDKDGNCESTSSREKMYAQLNTDEQIETRMKVGEVLVKVIQRLGELAPSYRVPLSNVFFRLVRDDEPFIRASALSNLGELCHLLKFSLGVVLTEVRL